MSEAALSELQRETFRELCALILPPWQQMPGAASLALEQGPLQRVLAARADLLAPLREALDSVGPAPSPALLQTLASEDPARLRLLLTVICGAYYLHAEVRAALGYPGQQALSLPRGGFGAEELVAGMLAQPKRYRDPGSIR